MLVIYALHCSWHQKVICNLCHGFTVWWFCVMLWFVIHVFIIDLPCHWWTYDYSLVWGWLTQLTLELGCALSLMTGFHDYYFWSLQLFAYFELHMFALVTCKQYVVILYSQLSGWWKWILIGCKHPKPCFNPQTAQVFNGIVSSNAELIV